MYVDFQAYLFITIGFYDVYDDGNNIYYQTHLVCFKNSYCKPYQLYVKPISAYKTIDSITNNTCIIA